MPQPVLRLSPEQQAKNLAAVHQAEFHPVEITSDLLGAGLWIAYLAFALAWFRTAVQGQRSERRASARDAVVAFATRGRRRLARATARIAERPGVRETLLNGSASGR